MIGQDAHEATAVATLLTIVDVLAGQSALPAPLKAYFKESLADAKQKPSLRSATLQIISVAAMHGTKERLVSVAVS